MQYSPNPRSSAKQHHARHDRVANGLGVTPKSRTAHKSLILLALPREARESLGINDLACSLGKSSGIALQGVSPAAPKLDVPKPSTAPAALPGTQSSDTQSSDSRPGVAIDSPDAHMRPLDPPEAANRNESAQSYSRLVAVLNGKWRVIECRDDIQWILQSRNTQKSLSTGVWRAHSYCRTRETLLRVCAARAGKIDPTAAAVLAALPDWIETPDLPAPVTHDGTAELLGHALRAG
jgi:hypothetical protein